MVDYYRRNRTQCDLPRNDGQADPSPLAEILPELLRRRGVMRAQNLSAPSTESASRGLPINPVVILSAGPMLTASCVAP